MEENIIRDLKDKMRSLKENRNKIYVRLNEIHPNTLRIVGGRYILLSDVDIVLESKEWEQKLENEDILRDSEFEDEYKKDEIYNSLQTNEEYFDGNDYEIEYLLSTATLESRWHKEILDYINNYKLEDKQTKMIEYKMKEINSNLVFNLELNDALYKIEEVIDKFDDKIIQETKVEVEAQGYLEGTIEFNDILEEECINYINYLSEEVNIQILDVVLEKKELLPKLKSKCIYGDKELPTFQIGRERRSYILELLDNLEQGICNNSIDKNNINDYTTFIRSFIRMNQNEFTNFQKKIKRRNENGLTSREQKKKDTILEIKKLKEKGFNQKETAIKTGFSTSTISRYWRLIPPNGK